MEQDGEVCTLARAGDTIEMGVTGIDPSALTTGSILCSISSPVRLAKKFEAKIMIMPAVEGPLVKGTYGTIYMHNVDEPVNITRLMSILSKTGEVEKKKPRCITRERSAVVQITCHRKICLEELAMLNGARLWPQKCFRTESTANSVDEFSWESWTAPDCCA
jgi:elongation factor 1 alpha-like protein